MLRNAAVYGQSWTEVNDGVIGASISSFVTQGDKIYVSCEAGGVYASNNDQIHWSSLNNGLTSSDIEALYSFAGNLYAGSYGNGVFISHDGGDSWSPADSGFLQSITYVNTFLSFGNSLFVGNDDAGYMSTDSGKHWQVAAWLGLQEVWAFAAAGNILYGGSEYGMHISLDSGMTWPYATSGLPSNANIKHVTVSGTRVLCAPIGYGIYASDDNGTNWASSSTGIPSSASVLSLFADGSTVYAGTDTYGIYRSADGGATWSNYSFGQSLPKITAFCKSNGIIYAGTDISGVLKLEDAANAVPQVASSSLHLFPNPAQSEILIQDNLNGIREITIVDAVGRCVWQSTDSAISSREISLQHLSPGVYTAIVDGIAIGFEKY